jgi:hypothetical protein
MYSRVQWPLLPAPDLFRSVACRPLRVLTAWVCGLLVVSSCAQMNRLGVQNSYSHKTKVGNWSEEMAAQEVRSTTFADSLCPAFDDNPTN